MTDDHDHDLPVGSLGPEILPGTWEYEWVASIVRAVERRTGRPSHWNGRLYEEPHRLLLATAHDDGTMSVSRADILEPVRLAYTAGRPLTTEENIAARRAAVTVAHEGQHLESDLGDDSVPGAVQRGAPEERALEEGLADTWAHRNGDAIIQDIGMDEVAPGVLEAEFAASYPGFMSATDGVMRGLSEITGLPPDEIRESVHRTERPQRYNAMADLVIDHRLGDLVPAEHRIQIQSKLVDTLRRELAGMTPVEYSDAFDGATLSGFGRESAELAITGLHERIGEIETHYRTWHEQNPGAGAEPDRMTMSLQDVLRMRQDAERQVEADQSTTGQATAAGGGAAAGSAVSGRAAASPPMSVAQREIAELRRFLGSHTAATEPGAAAGETPDNVRRLTPRDRGRGMD